MGEVIKTLRAAVLAAAGAIPGATRANAVSGMAATGLGAVTDAVGEELHVFRTPNGSVLVFGDSGTALGFDPAGAASLRQLLAHATAPEA